MRIPLYRERSSLGQAIAEGSAILIVIAMVFVGILLLIIATATAHYYHMKLLDVTSTVSKSVVANTFWEGNQFWAKPTQLTDKQDTMLTQILASTGLPANPNNRSVVITDDGNNNCVVELTVRGFPILGMGILPSAIALKAQAVEPWHMGHPQFSVMMATSMGPVLVPAFRPSAQNTSQPPGSTCIGAPPVYNDSNGNNIWEFTAQSMSSNSWGYGTYGLNYGNYGSSPPSGNPTSTGGNLAAFSPCLWDPVSPPPDAAYP